MTNEQTAPERVVQVRIHRFYNEILHDVKCMEAGCTWPPFTHLDQDLESVVHHVQTTGHKVMYAITDRCSVELTDNHFTPLAEGWLEARRQAGDLQQEEQADGE